MQRIIRQFFVHDSITKGGLPSAMDQKLFQMKATMSCQVVEVSVVTVYEGNTERDAKGQFIPNTREETLVFSPGKAFEFKPCGFVPNNGFHVAKGNNGYQGKSKSTPKTGRRNGAKGKGKGKKQK